MRKYLKNGKECILCEAREKLIQLTPEEVVRQEFIINLKSKYKVPKDMIEAEVPLSYYKKGGKGRVDILVSAISKVDNLKYPLIVVECKAPDVALTDKVFEQAEKYDSFLEPKLMILTNGNNTQTFAWDQNTKEYKELKEIPDYFTLIQNDDFEFKIEKNFVWERPDFKGNMNENHAELKKYGNIGEDSNISLTPFLTNLVGLLYDETVKTDALPLFNRKFLSDGGLRFTTFGNAAGGSFIGEYRYFLVENSNGDTDIVSLSIMGKLSTKNHPKWGNSKGFTLFNVAIDDFEKSHMSLEYSIDRFVEVNGEAYSFWHDGTLTVGKKGRAKNKDVIDFIKMKAPQLIRDDKVFLGKLDNSKEFNWNDSNVLNLIANFIEYGFVRDEFRKMKS